MDNKICNFLQQRVWAVVGASANPEKFGYKIFSLLRQYGYTVYPVNPKETSIDGQPCYANLAALPVVPDAVDVVVPPQVAVTIAEECKRLGINRLWFQPGVADNDVVRAAGASGLNFIHNRCVMVESSKLFLLGRKVWAVVADGKGEQARQTLLFLTEHGYTASLVAPDAKPNDGYSRLGELTAVPEAVIIAAGQVIASEIIKDCARLGIRCIWLQAGFETEELIHEAVSQGLIVIHHALLEEEFATIMPCRAGSPVP